jgi:hypothetical protein
MAQVCADLGLTATAGARVRGINADTGAPRGPWFCTTIGGTPPTLVLGESIIVEQLPPGPTLNPVPSHF